MTGNGTLTGATVTNKGNVAPGNAAGPLTANSAYTQTGSGALTVAVTGPSAVGTDFTQLKTSGAATLAGALAITTPTSYVPAIGSSYPIVVAGSVNGTFSSVSGRLLSDRGFTVTYTATSVVLKVVARPGITSILPTRGPLAAGTVVTVNGTDLQGASFAFGSAAATNVSVNSAGTQATVTAPAGAAGTVDVTATTGGGTSPAVSADAYTYVPPPAITSVSPLYGNIAGGTTVTVNGTDLTGATVNFGSSPASGVSVNAAGTTATVTSPAGSGVVDVTVTTIGGTSAVVAADQYSYVGVPKITSIAPTAGPTAGGTQVTLTGKNFTRPKSVLFGSTAGTVGSVNRAGTSIVVTAPAHAAGVVDIQLTTQGGTSAHATSDQFNYVAAPVVTGVSPASGPTAGGTTVTVTGSNLSGASVTFGSAAGTGVSVNGAGTQLSVQSPAGTGTVDIQVKTAGGTSAQVTADRFSYTNPSVSIGNASGAEGTGGSSSLTFPVTLSGTSPAAVTVRAATADATAVAPGDYTATSSTVTIPAGQTTANVVVPVVTDSKTEPNETFTVALSSPSGASLGTASATGTIINDDLPATISGTVSAPGSYTFGLIGTTCGSGCVSLCTSSNPCPTAGTWNLISQSFATSQLNFTWDGKGRFTMMFSSNQHNISPSLVFSVTDPSGVVTNRSTVTVHST